MLQVTVVKALILVSLFLLTLAFGILPVKLVNTFRKRVSVDERWTSHRRYRRVISCLSCFAAGVFFATCLLDLFPDVREKMNDVLHVMDVHSAFPIPEFVMSFGLFIILIAEQIVLALKERRMESKLSSEPLLGRQAEIGDESYHSELSISGLSDRVEEADAAPVGDRGAKAATLTSDTESEVESGPTAGDGAHTGEKHSQSVLRSMLLLLALSLHSVFEGLAVGLDRKTSSVLTIFGALLLHKCILSLSLGMNLAHSRLTQGAIVRSVLLFSLTAPFGIGIGLAIIDLWDSTASSLTQGLLQGIACGTFLYVTFFEIFPREFNVKGDRLIKLLFVIFGFSTVSVILFFHNDPETPIENCRHGNGLG